MKILLIDDRKEDRESLRELLGAYDHDVVAFASGTEGVAYLKKHKADIVLLDIVMQDKTGIETLKDIKAFNPEQDVILITAYAGLEKAVEGLRAGAYDFLKKPFTDNELFSALNRVRQKSRLQEAAYEAKIAGFSKEIIKSLCGFRIGGKPVGQKIARKALIEFLDENITSEHLLTQQEKKILDETEKGLRYKEIAAKLSISPHTVHTHIKKIYGKLQAKNRQQALITARKKGII